MSSEPPAPGSRPRRRPPAWRLGAVLAGVAAGALFVTSALDSQGHDLRASSVTDLSGLVLQQRQLTGDAEAELASMNRSVSRLSRNAVGSDPRLQKEISRLSGPAGVTAVTGPGVTVTLDDAPSDAINSALQSGQPPVEALLVHQQDIQAVVNVLWRSGATAVSVQDQRVISTTGIRCAGNVVILHGKPYSPPYVIKAVGNRASLAAGLKASSYLAAYRQIARATGLGYREVQSARLWIAPFTGPTTLAYAQPLPGN